MVRVFGRSLTEDAVGATGDRRLQFGVDKRKAAREAHVCYKQHSCCSGGGGGGEGGGSSSVSSNIQYNLKYGHQNHITRRFKYFQFLDNTVA